MLEASYKHEPIQHADGFRLLYLHEGRHENDMEVSINNVRFQDNPLYEAVSYTWANSNGDTTLSERLRIRSGNSIFILPITQNCKNALKRFQRPDRIIYLWLDSICIDQSNMYERSHQVGVMTKIYQCAVRVLVYLGDGVEFGSDSSNCVERLFRYILEHRFHESMGEDLVTLFQRAPQNIVRDLKVFFSLRWFQRIWVIQEVKVAKAAVVVCGEHELDWKYLEIDRYQSYNYEGEDLIAPVDISSLENHIPAILRIRRRRYPRRTDFADLLVATRTYQATDARDRIFALLWCQQSADFNVLKPDYTKSVSEVFTEATIYCIQISQSLKILSLVQQPVEETNSWVPNFSQSDLPLLSSWGWSWDKTVIQKSFDPFLCHTRSSKAEQKGNGLFNPRRTVTTQRFWPKDLSHSPKRHQLNISGCQLGQAQYVTHGLIDISNLENLRYQIHGSHIFPEQERNMAAFKQFNSLVSKAIGAPVGIKVPPVFLHCFNQQNSELYPSKIPYYCRCVLDRLIYAAKRLVPSRRIIFTELSVAIGPSHTKKGDAIYYVPGAATLLILRKKYSSFLLVGECFLLEGHRNNQAWYCGDSRERDASCPCQPCQSTMGEKTSKDLSSVERLSLI